MAYEFDRNLKDANFVKTKALPAAGAANQTASMDLGGPNTIIPESLQLMIQLPATPALVDAKSITLTVKDSADNASFAAISELPVFTLTGGGGSGAAALTKRLALPSTTRRYLQIDQAVEAAGGDNTGVTGTYTILF